MYLTTDIQLIGSPFNSPTKNPVSSAAKKLTWSSAPGLQPLAAALSIIIRRTSSGILSVRTTKLSDAFLRRITERIGLDRQEHARKRDNIFFAVIDKVYTLIIFKGSWCCRGRSQGRFRLRLPASRKKLGGIGSTSHYTRLHNSLCTKAECLKLPLRHSIVTAGSRVASQSLPMLIPREGLRLDLRVVCSVGIR